GSPRPGCAVSSTHDLPPSSLRNSPLPEAAFGPSPPDRKVQPLRRKSHRLASSTLGLSGAMLRLPHPVEGLEPLSTSCQLLPPSVVRYKPRSVESLHSLPGTHASTVSEARGSTTMREMRSESGKPACVQVSPPSVDR